MRGYRYRHRLSIHASPQRQTVRYRALGHFGLLPSQFATPLALVINEVVANAVEHGLNGETGRVTLEGAETLMSRGIIP